MKQEKAGLFELFLSFASIGVCTFGGGYAMLPMLERELVEKKKWSTNDELLDYYAVGQCTPGIIAINTATFVGRKERGIPGAIAATLGMLFPSIVIITVIAALLSGFAENPWVKKAFAGIRVCVCVLILNSVIKLFKSGVKGKKGLVIFGAALLLSVLAGVGPVALVLLCAGFGLAEALLEGRKK